MCVMGGGKLVLGVVNYYINVFTTIQSRVHVLHPPHPPPLHTHTHKYVEVVMTLGCLQGGEQLRDCPHLQSVELLSLHLGWDRREGHMTGAYLWEGRGSH